MTVALKVSHGYIYIHGVYSADFLLKYIACYLHLWNLVNPGFSAVCPRVNKHVART